MKVNSNRDISFTSIYTNKALKRGLEFAEENGALFAATTTLGLSAFARPAAIWLAPHTDKENKKVACAKSLSSSLAGYILMLGLSNPVSKAIKKIDKNPDKYLKPQTIKKMQLGAETLKQSKSYILATQMFKLGLGIVVAAPKAILTCAGMPFIMHKIFHKPEQKKEEKGLIFKGKNTDRLAEKIGKVIDSPAMQKFSEKFKNSNFAMHIIAATDILNTAVFIHEINRSNKIEERRKKAVNYNAGISTGMSVASGYVADKLLDKPTERFIQKFRIANKGMPNVEKQIEGIKIAKPILLVGGIYYIVIPFISTFLADRAEHSEKLDRLIHSSNKNHDTILIECNRKN